MTNWEPPHKTIKRQLAGGLHGAERCIPCKNAVEDADISRIGSKSRLNHGLDGCKDLDKPAIYCGLCRHIQRAKELARRKGEETSVPPVSVENCLYYDYKTYEYTLDRCTFIHDDEDLGGLPGF
jgi:hypothetical protein